MMSFEEIKKYWEDRAASDSSAQSTTQDYYLREIEYNVLFERIKKYSPDSVADVGCGDGKTTYRLANNFNDILFSGFDYSSFMVKNAADNIRNGDNSRLQFDELDICTGLKNTYSLIYTTRCLINLPSWDLQKIAISNIHLSLPVDGIYLMIENFIDGQENFNRIRKDFDLPEIPVREHNLFFKKSRLFDFVNGLFKIEEDINISSSYYLMSRIVYSKICSEKGEQPNYFDDHHRFASKLPFAGDFGPVRLVCLKKV